MKGVKAIMLSHLCSVRRLRVVVAQALRALSADLEPRGRSELQQPPLPPPLDWTAQPHPADAAVTHRAPTLPLLREMLSQVECRP